MRPQLNVERLIECRTAINISKLEASKRVKVTQPAYLRYEQGVRNPSVQVITQMARVFNTSVDYLTGVTDKKEPDTIVVSNSDSPVIFEIVKKCENFSEEQLKKMLTYARKL